MSDEMTKGEAAQVGKKIEQFLRRVQGSVQILDAAMAAESDMAKAEARTAELTAESQRLEQSISEQTERERTATGRADEAVDKATAEAARRIAQVNEMADAKIAGIREEAERDEETLTAKQEEIGREVAELEERRDEAKRTTESALKELADTRERLSKIGASI